MARCLPQYRIVGKEGVFKGGARERKINGEKVERKGETCLMERTGLWIYIKAKKRENTEETEPRSKARGSTSTEHALEGS